MMTCESFINCILKERLMIDVHCTPFMFVVYCFSSINVFIRVVSEVWSNIKQTAYKPKFPCLRRSVGVPGSHLPGVMISIL